MPSEQYVPERFDDLHFKVLIEVKPCALCEIPTTPNLHHRHGPFPKDYGGTFAAQLSRGGIQLVQAYNSEGKPLCGKCSQSRSVYRCEICHTDKTEAETQWRGGGGQYFLCKACYETTPAAAWDLRVFELAGADNYPGCGPL
jgi:hypothetical protein